MKVEFGRAVTIPGPEPISADAGSRLVAQFVLSAGRSLAPAGWIVEAIGSWFLGRHRLLPAVRLVRPGHVPVGWVLGYPISETGRMPADGEALAVSDRTLESGAAMEELIYSFGGRFAVVLIDAQQPRLYLDPFGSLSAVYCTRQRVIASTPNVIPRDEHTRDRTELAKAIGIPHTDGMYPLGLTPRFGIERLLPNHYLDLSRWQAIRHWPRQPLSETESAGEAIAEITAIIKRQMAAIVAATPAYLYLTAGKDSRILLACARDLADRLEPITIEIGDESAAIDCDTARRIARRLGLKHRIVPMEAAAENDLKEWMFRISYGTGETRGLRSSTAVRHLPGGHAMLIGNGAELGSNFYMRRRFAGTAVVHPEQLLKECLCPPEDAALSRMRAWLATVPAETVLQTVDLFFLEQRIGCWAGVWPYAECDPGFTMFPVCHRRAVERMLTLPASYRNSNDLLARDIISREWPELLDWPINRPVGSFRLLLGARKTLQKAARAARHPGRAISFVHRALVRKLSVG